jgi:hypothetical protein
MGPFAVSTYWHSTVYPSGSGRMTSTLNPVQYVGTRVPVFNPPDSPDLAVAGSASQVETWEEQMRTKHLAASGYACYAKAHVASADAYPAQEGR